LRPAEPGELLDVREAAHFEVDGYADHINVTGVTGTYIDLVRRGAGSTPAVLRISHTVDAAIATPSSVSSPWIRRYPTRGSRPPGAGRAGESKRQCADVQALGSRSRGHGGASSSRDATSAPCPG
jgi:hypothetical protein